ncbi:hypothetical protein DESC_120004 [Desulfosarcina cetonica]|nr:hypothetical protein DESC_120004 [Desulfosarcina cetonica]
MPGLISDIYTGLTFIVFTADSINQPISLHSSQGVCHRRLLYLDIFTELGLSLTFLFIQAAKYRQLPLCYTKWLGLIIKLR